MKSCKMLTCKKMLGIFSVLVPSFVFASDNGDSVNFVVALNNFLGYLTGDVGTALALLAIVGVGYGCFVLGQLSKGAALTTVLGIAIVFGAHGLLSVLTGGA